MGLYFRGGANPILWAYFGFFYHCFVHHCLHRAQHSTTSVRNGQTLSSNFFVATRMNKFPRVLTLDGGGVRELSSLIILRDLMENIGQAKDLPETLKPSEYFDLIGGTSTGGLIAIMLGLLGMVFSPAPSQTDVSRSMNVSMSTGNYRAKSSILIV